MGGWMGATGSKSCTDSKLYLGRDAQQLRVSDGIMRMARLAFTPVGPIVRGGLQLIRKASVAETAARVIRNEGK